MKNNNTGLLSTENQWKTIGFILEFLGFFLNMAGITLIFNELLGTNHDVMYAFQMAAIGYIVLVGLKHAFPRKSDQAYQKEIEKLHESIQASIKEIEVEVKKGQDAKKELNTIQNKLAPEGFKREVVLCDIGGRPKLLILEYPDQPEFTESRMLIDTMIDELFDDTIISTQQPARKETVPQDEQKELP